MQILNVLGGIVFLFGSLALSVLAGSIAARITRHVPSWCLLTLAGCALLNVGYLQLASPLIQWLNAAEGAGLNWRRLGDDSLRNAAYGALLGLLGFIVILRNAPQFFKRRA